jgi:hypothetical protein
MSVLLLGIKTRRNSAKASRQELIIRRDIRLFSLKTALYNLSNISGVMGSFFSMYVINRRFAPSNTFLAIRLLVGDVFPNSMPPVYDVVTGLTVRFVCIKEDK